jgi:hypothetical protein
MYRYVSALLLYFVVSLASIGIVYPNDVLFQVTMRPMMEKRTISLTQNNQALELRPVRGFGGEMRLSISGYGFFGGSFGYNPAVAATDTLPLSEALRVGDITFEPVDAKSAPRSVEISIFTTRTDTALRYSAFRFGAMVIGPILSFERLNTQLQVSGFTGKENTPVTAHADETTGFTRIGGTIDAQNDLGGLFIMAQKYYNTSGYLVDASLKRNIVFAPVTIGAGGVIEKYTHETSFGTINFSRNAVYLTTEIRF